MSKTLEVGMSPRVGPRTIVASRLKASLYLLTSLIFVALGVMMIQDPSSGIGGWFGVIFFGFGAVVFAIQLIRPQTLTLDIDGFMLSGGLVRSPKKVLWRDVQGFFVYRLPKGGKMIGYNWEPGAKKDTTARRIVRAFGADGALPKGWPGDPERMVEDLNAYRLWALSRR